MLISEMVDEVKFGGWKGAGASAGARKVDQGYLTSH